MSLRVRLLLIIGLGLSALWTAVAAWMFLDARQSLIDALDNRLAASARMVAGMVAQLPEPAYLTAQKSAKPFDLIARDGVACEVSLLRSQITARALVRTAGGPDLTQANAGFGTHMYGKKRWRTYMLRQGNIQIATADSMDTREALVKELALSAGVPFLVALFGSLIMLWFCITHGIAPLERVRDVLAKRKPGDDSPLAPIKAPLELQPLLNTIEQLLERLQGAILRERRFTDNAAHELRTPLTGIKTHIQVAGLAAELPDDNKTLKTALSKADHGVLQLQGILDRLLSLARLDDDAVPAESCDPLEVVYTAAEQLQASYPDIKNRVLISAENSVASLNVARPLLLSATQNLIDNALRYTPDDIPIIVQITQPNIGRIRISVLDEGPGLNAHDRAHAVNRFWRRDRSVPGSGLGLSIVDAIARRHHGTFELLARAGHGLEARLEFPI